MDDELKVLLTLLLIAFIAMMAAVIVKRFPPWSSAWIVGR
jgi:hypothetical protein